MLLLICMYYNIWTRALHMSQSTVCLLCCSLLMHRTSSLARRSPAGRGLRPLILCPKHYLQVNSVPLFAVLYFDTFFNQSWYSFTRISDTAISYAPKIVFNVIAPLGIHNAPSSKDSIIPQLRSHVLLSFNQSISYLLKNTRDGRLSDPAIRIQPDFHYPVKSASGWPLRELRNSTHFPGQTSGGAKKKPPDSQR